MSRSFIMPVVALAAIVAWHAPALMTTYATTLAAISVGAVFIGASNAPNLMVKAIAEGRPSISALIHDNE